VLAQPLAFAFGQVAGLELDLGRLPLPIDLRAGVARFRHRRAVAMRGEIRLDLDVLCAHLFSEGRVLACEGEAIAIALRDPVRTVACEVVPAIERRDLWLAVRRARAARDGPRPPIAEVLVAFTAAGAELDPDRGTLRIADPVCLALTEALVPHGWRVPDLVGTPRGQVRIEGRTLVLPFGRTEPLSEPVRRAHEEARAMAPVLEALVADQLTDAEQRLSLIHI